MSSTESNCDLPQQAANHDGTNEVVHTKMLMHVHAPALLDKQQQLALAAAHSQANLQRIRPILKAPQRKIARSRERESVCVCVCLCACVCVHWCVCVYGCVHFATSLDLSLSTSDIRTDTHTHVQTHAQILSLLFLWDLAMVEDRPGSVLWQLRKKPPTAEGLADAVADADAKRSRAEARPHAAKTLKKESSTSGWVVAARQLDRPTRSRARQARVQDASRSNNSAQEVKQKAQQSTGIESFNLNQTASRPSSVGGLSPYCRGRWIVPCSPPQLLQVWSKVQNLTGDASTRLHMTAKLQVCACACVCWLAVAARAYQLLVLCQW